MPIHHAKHSTRFFRMQNDTVKDVRISFKAKGILAYFLSKPEDWKVI